MSGVRITGRGVVESLSTFLRDAGGFLVDHPLLPAGLVVLAVVVFHVTGPRVR